MTEPVAIDVSTLPIVRVTWQDSRSWGGWRQPQEWLDAVNEGAHQCESVGYVLHRNPFRLLLVQSRSTESGNVADMIEIPISALLEVVPLAPVGATGEL